MFKYGARVTGDTRRAAVDATWPVPAWLHSPVPNVDATAIPWLRLKATSTSAGPDGDRLERTAYVQRINTTGGVAPAAADCNASTAGAQVEVPYTADYYFWKETGR